MADKPTPPTPSVVDAFRILLPDPRVAETIDQNGRRIGMRSITRTRVTTVGSRQPWEDPAPRNDRLDEDQDQPKPSRGPRG